MEVNHFVTRRIDDGGVTVSLHLTITDLTNCGMELLMQKDNTATSPSAVTMDDCSFLLIKAAVLLVGHFSV